MDASFTRRKLLLLALVAAGSFLVSRFRAGPATDGARLGAARGEAATRAHLVAWAEQAHGLVVAPDEVRLAPAADGPLGWGRPAVAVFAARRAPDAPRDVYRARLRLSGRGVPVAVGPPADLTATPDGDEVVLDADGERVLYGIRVGGRFESVVLLDFGRSWLPPDVGWPARLVAGLVAWQSFGTWRGPRRTDVVLGFLPATLAGRLTARGMELISGRGDGEAVTIAVDVESGTVHPPGQGRILEAATPQLEAGGLLADALRRSVLVGPDHLASVEAVLFELVDGLRRLRHRLLPEEADRVPVEATVQAVADGEDGAAWPPPPIPVAGGGLEGEGRWMPAGLGEPEDADPPVRRTFVRVDPARPYEKIHLFAFDMTRLGLHFVAGTRHPRSTTGVRGRGTIPAGDRARLVAAFNGGFKTEHGAFGTVEDGRVLVPPAPGLATILVDAEGRAALGVWAGGDDLPVGWTGLRQNLPPLVAGGKVNPTRTRSWGRVVARLDGVHTPRSALGVTAAGLLVYAWAGSASAEQVGEALRRAGARFAVHLDMNPGHTGLELYVPDPEAGLRAAPGVREMDFRPRRWLGVDARDFFYVTRRPGLPSAMPAAGDEWGPGEGRWRPVEVARRPGDPFPPVATSHLSPARAGGRHEVRLVLLDAGRLRVHLVPGLAEARPPDAAAVPEALELGALPVAWLEIGLQAPGTDRGMVVAGRTWRPPRRGLMTFAADEDGRAVVGVWGEDGPAGARPGSEWRVVRQGVALLEGGRPTAAASGRAGMPAAAIGQDRAGRLVFAAVEDGDRAALARALALAGARDGLLLGGRSTADTGVTRFMFRDGERILERTGPEALPRPARLEAGAGSALVFTPRPPDPRAFAAEGLGSDGIRLSSP